LKKWCPKRHEELFFWSSVFFEFLLGQVWEFSGKNPEHHQKFACSYTYLLTSQQSALTQKPRENVIYLQLDGMINWLHAAMTIFVQQFSICSSKFERSAAPIVPSWLRTWQQ